MSKDRLDRIAELGAKEQALIEIGLQLDRMSRLFDHVFDEPELARQACLMWWAVHKAHLATIDEIAALKQEVRRD